MVCKIERKQQHAQGADLYQNVCNSTGGSTLHLLHAHVPASSVLQLVRGSAMSDAGLAGCGSLAVGLCSLR